MESDCSRVIGRYVTPIFKDNQAWFFYAVLSRSLVAVALINDLT